MTTAWIKKTSTAVRVLACLGAVAALGWARPVAAQYCMEYDPPLILNGSSTCQDDPDSPRAFFPGIFTWPDAGGVDQEYLMFSDGNDLSLQRLIDPQNPFEISRGSFGVGNLGDSDYDLLSYHVCDGCRRGMAVYKLATVFFDLGVANLPLFTADYVSEEVGEIPYGMTFQWQGYQYLIAAGLNNFECGPEGSGLYLFNSLNPFALPLLQCLEDFNSDDLLVTGGMFLQDDDLNGGTPYIWGGPGTYFYIFEVTGTAANLRLNYVKTVAETRIFARSSHVLGFDVDLNAGAFANDPVNPDPNAGIAVTVYPYYGFQVWRIDDLSNPTSIATFTGDDGNNLASLAYPIAWVGTYNATGQETTYDISDPYDPVLLEDTFWNATKSWNDWPCATIQTGSTFNGSGEFLFAGRFEVLQRFDFRNCQVPEAPVAGIIVEHRAEPDDPWQAVPASVFPGDQLRVTSTSTGVLDSTEIWLSETDGGGTVASSTGSPVADPLLYTIPIGGGPDGEPSTAYTAHVSVTNAGGTDEQAVQIPIDLSPMAVIDFQPAS